MRLHTSSFVAGMPMFTGIKPLRGYEDSIGRFKVDDADVKTAKEFISKFNIENFSDELAAELINCDFEQLALVFAILSKYQSNITMGLIHAYALRCHVTLSTEVYEQILILLEQKGILIAQTDYGVIKYNLQKETLSSFYAIEH